ncbi:MAG: AraC family transcriptional regulator [Treponema sp.]|jgi:AraC-like DNA-binding protein|nr:AraC family transcriptional regulator [Treponema sp.]
MEEDDLFVPDIQYLVFRKCPADWRLKPHHVSNYDITYIIKGKARYTIDQTLYELSQGALLCLPEGVSKAAFTYADHPMHCFSVNFILKNTAGQKVDIPFPHVNDVGLRNDLIRLFNDLVYTHTERQAGYGIKCRGLLLLIIHRLLELTVYNTNASDEDYRIQKAIRYITQHYTERLTVKKLSIIAGLNAAYFGVLFKRATGLTVNRYIAATRVQKAKNLLQSGGCSVQDAAEYCGYCDVFHFYKQFKSIVGVPPSRYIPKGGTRHED